MIIRTPAGCGYSTALSDFDFESYSEAGYIFDTVTNKWQSITSSAPHGLGAVGASAYSEHPSTEILSLAYNLKDGSGRHLWKPGDPDPVRLFDHITAGKLLDAWNSGFEYYLWLNVCHARMGWPNLPLEQLRDAMAKARAHALPGGLGNAANAIAAPVRKLADGKRLITKFSKPRNPTKNDPRRRILPTGPDAEKLYEYNLVDIESQASVSAMIPDLSEYELQVWLLDQRINARGVAVDMDALHNCTAVVDQALASGLTELHTLTAGKIDSPNKIKKIISWVMARGLYIASLDADTVTASLARENLRPEVRRVLEIRAALGSASVKKLGAMSRRVSADGRLRGMFIYCGASRTGRWSGKGPQPHNFPNSGPDVNLCLCGEYYDGTATACSWCGNPEFMAERKEWNHTAVERVLEVATSRNSDCMKYYFGDPLAVISGSLRGMLCAGPGKELISSDYSAIEAVVLAAGAGEEWRLNVFHTHGKIYEMSAAKITGIPFEEFLRHKSETGEHHPMRKKIGKIAELGSGYGGGVGAWKNFGAEKHFDSDDDIKAAVKQWRSESPCIVDFWYSVERAAVAAIKSPGVVCCSRDFSDMIKRNPSHGQTPVYYGMKNDVLYCRLPSGRLLSYHAARLHPDTTPWGKPVERITYMSATNKGWLRVDSYGGKLVENWCQAVARDILADAMLRLDGGGYPIVMHVHDEPVSEVPIGFGSIEEYEKIMAVMPAWAKGWPIRANGGWRGKRYRKD